MCDSRKAKRPPGFFLQFGALQLGGGVGGGSQLTHINEFRRERQSVRERERNRKEEQVQGGG